jgi:two-component system, chemotaxis family, chemotaxis protein CheY
MDNKNAGGEGRELNILVVDDSAMMRAMIGRVVDICDFPGVNVLFASNGKEALQVLAEKPVRAVFTDINMPEMNGVELLRQVRQRPEWRQILCVVISTDGSDARKQEVSELDVKAYLEKPFSPEVMRDVLTGLFEPCAQTR